MKALMNLESRRAALAAADELNQRWLRRLQILVAVALLAAGAFVGSEIRRQAEGFGLTAPQQKLLEMLGKGDTEWTDRLSASDAQARLRMSEDVFVLAGVLEELPETSMTEFWHSIIDKNKVLGRTEAVRILLAEMSRRPAEERAFMAELVRSYFSSSGRLRDLLNRLDKADDATRRALLRATDPAAGLAERIQAAAELVGVPKYNRSEVSQAALRKPRDRR